MLHDIPKNSYTRKWYSHYQAQWLDWNNSRMSSTASVASDHEQIDSNSDSFIYVFSFTTVH